MKILDNTLYVEYGEMLSAGIAEGTIKSSLQREIWGTQYDPDDKRKVLIQYESLKDNYKALLKAKYGDPYEYMSAAIIKQHLITTEADRNFITNYKLPDGTNLPLDTQHEYLRSCAVLHLLSSISVSRIKRMGFANAPAFNTAVLAHIKANDIGLPGSYAKLKEKVRGYNNQGTRCVIHKGWCNSSAKKVNDETCEAVLLQMVSHSNQFEDTIVAHRYNKWATGAGYKTITDSTVGRIRRKQLMNITAARNGDSAWHNQFNPVVHRNRPTQPLYLINSDDNTLDLFFNEGRNDYRRVVLMVVTDAFNDYPLGYAIGNSQTKELVQEAFLNAVHHVHELTGEYLWTHQIQTDGWGISRKKDDKEKVKTDLEKWYEKQAIFTPTRVHNARGKTIERTFGTVWHQQLKRYDNWSGYNITAKHKPNPEAIKRNRKNFPTLDQAPAQVNHFINALRTHVFESGVHAGKSLQQEWLEAYTAMPANDPVTGRPVKKYLDDTKRMLLFGTKHSHKNTITNRGLEVAISGRKIKFDIPEHQYAEYVGSEVQVFYDPYDLTSCLATSADARVQILCPVNEPMKMAVMDMTEGDRLKLNVRLTSKDTISQAMLDRQMNRQSILDELGIQASSLLQAGVLIKDQKLIAENTYFNELLSIGAEADTLPRVPEASSQGGALPGEDLDVFDLMVNNTLNQQEAGI